MLNVDGKENGFAAAVAVEPKRPVPVEPNVVVPSGAGPVTPVVVRSWLPERRLSSIRKNFIFFQNILMTHFQAQLYDDYPAHLFSDGASRSLGGQPPGGISSTSSFHGPKLRISFGIH